MNDSVHVGENLARRRPKWRMALVILAVIVLAGAAGVGVRYWQNNRTGSGLPAGEATAVADQSQQLAASGSFTAAQALLADELKKPQLSASDKYQFYYQQGANYIGVKNTRAALDSFSRAAKYGKTQGLYQSMAAAAQTLGDKQAAIDYYKKAIQYIPASNPTGEMDKQNYQQAIISLGGKP